MLNIARIRDITQQFVFGVGMVGRLSNYEPANGEVTSRIA